MRKIASQRSVLHLIQLVFHTLISGNSDYCGRPPLGHGGNKHRERLLGPCHVSIIKLGIDQLQRCSDKLRGADAVCWACVSGCSRSSDFPSWRHTLILQTRKSKLQRMRVPSGLQRQTVEDLLDALQSWLRTCLVQHQDR